MFIETLLANMGNVHVQMVEQEVEELEVYRSSAQIVIQELVKHPDEERLIQTLVCNMELCCKMLVSDPSEYTLLYSVTYPDKGLCSL